MSNDDILGSCFCGGVELKVKGEPTAMLYCHCKDCQSWGGAPINSASLWDENLVEVTKGQELIETFNKTDFSFRKFCKKCGGHLMNGHPSLKLIDIFAVILKGFSYEPNIHINYENKTVSVKDGLPKFKDMPKELGGSGETIDE